MKKKINWLDLGVKVVLFVLSSLGIYNSNVASSQAKDANRAVTQFENSRIVPADYYVSIPGRDDANEAESIDLSEGFVVYLYWSKSERWMPGSDVYLDIQTIYTDAPVTKGVIEKLVTPPIPGSKLELVYKVVPLGLDPATRGKPKPGPSK